LLFVVAVIGVLAAMAIPQFLVGVDRSRAVAAARYVTQQCGAARVQAIVRSATVALRFRPHEDDYLMQMFIDRNHNGVRTADIDANIDLPLGMPELLGSNFPGVRIGIVPGLPIGNDPVRLGASGLLSFTPVGTATSGSVYIAGKDGTQFAVRVLGVTARTRLERFDPRKRAWVSYW
jgi:hypothetical protein